MAKTTFAKLGLKMPTDISTVQMPDSQEAFDVKHYLPVEEKLELISRVVNQCQDTDNNVFINSVKLDMFFELEVIFAYTNITFTEKQKENRAKLFDLIKAGGLFKLVAKEIPDEELHYLYNACCDCAEQIYTYRQSAIGIMDTISSDYNNLDLDAKKIQQSLANGENISLLKNILTNYG